MILSAAASPSRIACSRRGRSSVCRGGPAARPRDRARTLTVTPTEAGRFGIELSKDGQRRTAFELLSHPEIGIAEIGRIWPEFLDIPSPIAAQLEIDAKYALYLDRQAADVAAFRR